MSKKAYCVSGCPLDGH